MTPISVTLESNLRTVLGADEIRSATPGDAVCGIRPQLVLEPSTDQQLASALRAANETKLAVIPRGGGTKLGWGNPPSRADLILSTARLNKTLEHAWADLTVTVEAGCSIQTLQQTLAQHGQRLAIDTLWPERATVGGILSTNDSGALRLRFGALRDLIIGVTIALPDGTLASSGGRVVKNVAGYDLPKLITGAHGTIGVITRAVFRLHPVPQFARTFTVVGTGFLPEAQRLLLVIQDSQLAHSALQIRFLEESPQPHLDILLEGTEAGISNQLQKLKSLVEPATVAETDQTVWIARQELFSEALQKPCVLGKISVLPAKIEGVVGSLCSVAVTRVRYKAVVQATGIGHVLLEGESEVMASILKILRSAIEKSAGSLVLLHRPAAFPPFDAWGTHGDSLPLMKAIKHQLDPSNTLNPGRFLGGI